MASSDSALAAATAKVAAVKSADGTILTEPFLDVCRAVLPVIDKLGTAFTLVRGDVSGNINRLAGKMPEDPQFVKLFAIVQFEIVKSTHGHSTSATKGLLWLKRAMEFTLAILQRTAKQPDVPLAQVVTDAYAETLMQFHGFFASNAFYLAFKFVPTRESFVESLGVSQGANVTGEIDAFVAAFKPILSEVHDFLSKNGLDDPTKV